MSVVTTPDRWTAHRSILLGFAAIFVMLAGLSVWGVGVRIAGAIVVTGTVRVETDRQIVQHPDGGVVGQIAANDGDVVQQGDVLIRFDDSFAKAELSMLDLQLLEILVRKIRLEGERDNAARLDFSQTDTFAHLDPIWVQGQIRGQTDLFEARMSSLATEREQLGEQRHQIEKQIAGMRAQTVALTVQGDLVELELNDQQNLLNKGLVPVARVLALRREHAAVAGEFGRLNAGIAEASGRMVGLSIALVQLSQKRREAAIARLRDLRYSEIELVGKRIHLHERLGRMAVRAPLGGTVFGSRVSALQSVVRLADPIMYIVPVDQPMQVIVRIDPVHIDQVYAGQVASLRFRAFDMRATPPVPGRVVRFSPDTLRDDATGAPYYQAVVVPQDGALAGIGDKRILPGMPVEAFLKTQDRTPFSYLTEPLTAYFRRAFRES